MSGQTNGSVRRIQEKLNHLCVDDTAYKVFGASTHRYRLGAPLTAARLDEVERRLRVKIPREYRNFLANIGHGGAGPYYGLFRLDKHDEEDITAIDILAQPFPWTGCIKKELPQQDEDGNVDEADENSRFLEMSVPGALYICHYGCALRFFLVVNGPCQGEVWHDFRADGRGVYPATAAKGHRLGFFAWYERWLDESLAEVRSG